MSSNSIHPLINRNGNLINWKLSPRLLTLPCQTLISDLHLYSIMNTEQYSTIYYTLYSYIKYSYSLTSCIDFARRQYGGDLPVSVRVRGVLQTLRDGLPHLLPLRIQPLRLSRAHFITDVLI